ncbi:pirin family protein [Streptomyces sp. N2-109]|uniref:Pirin family protein n=1 Tax=Streptomyces gossypii TaxID=2883101 RepID=A0ABT2JQV7_9ACTN|nr:pirin family protein [Streptomyces gossypii]MCT2590265.1 pirin family protein [Streptomyces gossypii]
MLQVWRADDRYRGGDAAAGIDTRHAFSFAGFYDPGNVRFGSLVACNEERLAPGAGFGPHPHRDVEIVTWVLRGVLEHEDSTGHTSRVLPGDVQRLSAGDGVRHAERNAGDEELRFLQMWLAPGPGGTGAGAAASPAASPAPSAPDYEVVSGIADGTPYRMPRTDAVLHVRRLGAGGRTALPDAPWVYAHVVRGAVEIGGERLGPGDAARITRARGLWAREPDVPDAELLLWEMHAEPGYG